jgi:hypothetical protein
MHYPQIVRVALRATGQNTCDGHVIFFPASFKRLGVPLAMNQTNDYRQVLS